MGLAFNGNAPDMGCFEFGSSDIDNLSISAYQFTPNPVHNQLFIKQEQPQYICIKLMDNCGREILQLQTGQKIIPVKIDNLPSGIYHILITKQEHLYLQKINIL